MEQVLVVERAGFFAGQWPHGFVPIEAAAGAEWLERFAAAARFVDRDQAEAAAPWIEEAGVPGRTTQLEVSSFFSEMERR